MLASIKDEMVTAFIDEARLAALLQHENIIHVYDFGEMDGGYFIAMEYLFGKELRAIVTRNIADMEPSGALLFNPWEA